MKGSAGVETSEISYQTIRTHNSEYSKLQSLLYCLHTVMLYDEVFTGIKGYLTAQKYLLCHIILRV